MGRRVSAFSLIELTITIAILSIVAIALARVATAHLEGSLYADDAITAANLARYEQELSPSRSATANWCSVSRALLPPGDPDRSACPAAWPSEPNPYAGLPFVIYRLNAAQAPTDGSPSGGLRRITVRVKRVLQSSGLTITAVEPLVTVTTDLPNASFGVSFGP